MFRQISCCLVAVVLVPSLVLGNEVDGFRLGMSMEQAMKAATEKGFSFGKAMPGTHPNWTSYTLFKDGPAISFCGNVLTSLIKNSDSNLHEFAHTLESWTKSFGDPVQMAASQTFAQGSPLSNLNYSWVRENVRPSLSFFQWGTGDLRMSFGFSYISHPCRPSTR